MQCLQWLAFPSNLFLAVLKVREVALADLACSDGAGLWNEDTIRQPIRLQGDSALSNHRVRLGIQISYRTLGPSDIRRSHAVENVVEVRCVALAAVRPFQNVLFEKLGRTDVNLGNRSFLANGDEVGREPGDRRGC